MDVLKSTIILLAFSLELSFVLAEKLPSGISERLYCEGCSATVKEIMKKVNKKTGDSLEVRVIEALEDICSNQHFKSYDFSPPSTAKACKLLLERHEEEMETLLQDKSFPDKEKAICYELSKACEGVDRSQKPKEDMDVRVNDQKQELHKGSDGINRMNVDINDPNAAKSLADQIKSQLNLQNQGGEGGEEDGDDEEEEEEEDGGKPAPSQGTEDTGERVLSLEQLEKLAKEEEEAEKAEKLKSASGQEEKAADSEAKPEQENAGENVKTEL